MHVLYLGREACQDQGFLSAGTGPHGGQLPQPNMALRTRTKLLKGCCTVKNVSSLICNADCKKLVLLETT